jgi:prepilin-type N-terminal cleavage/methylation domain-containing protein
MTRASHAPKRGFTTLEMLIAMGVLGVILTVAAALLQSNQRATDVQQARTNSLEDARLAASRLIETVNQAAYIFPAGQRIQVNGLTGRAVANEVTTGANAGRFERRAAPVSRGGVLLGGPHKIPQRPAKPAQQPHRTVGAG